MTRPKAFLLLLALLVAALAYAGGDLPLPGKARSWSESSAVTRSAPNDAGEGMSLINVTGYTLQVCANQPVDGGVGMLTGTGTVITAYYDPFNLRWVDNPRLAQNQSAVYKQCQVFPSFVVTAPFGRVHARPDSMLNDGGTGVTVRIDARTEP